MRQMIADFKNDGMGETGMLGADLGELGPDQSVVVEVEPTMFTLFRPT